MPLGAWPRVRLATIRLELDETKLGVQRSGDPAGQRKLVADKPRRRRLSGSSRSWPNASGRTLSHN
jgi:hypothetical protein